MTGAEKGFLLLTSQLGDRERKPLTAAQFRELAKRMRAAQRYLDDRDVQEQDLLELGYDLETARRIVGLLGGTNRLRQYLHVAQTCGCTPITRLDACYPMQLRKRLGLDAPGCLWTKGPVMLLEKPMLALVGSRDLFEENRRFAEAAGKMAARQGFVLLSGNARGADRTAQEAALAAGGQVVSVIADSLQDTPERENVLYLSQQEFDQPFSATRALSRNRIIHALPQLTLVAQCTLEKGGTWSGTVQNLRYGWSGVCCFDDGSRGAEALIQRGARPVKTEDLKDMNRLLDTPGNLFDR